MEHIPDTAVYHTEVLDDELGTGVRIQCSDGSLYEARQLGGLETRLYREYGEYTVTVATDASPGSEAYETTAAFAARLDEAYGTSFERWLENDTGDEEVLEGQWRHTAGSSLRYDPDHDVEFPDVELPKMDFYESWNLGWGTGVLLNIALAGGALSGPFALGLGSLSFIGGTVAPHVGEYVGEKWKERKYSSGDVVERESLFERLSEEDYLSRLSMEADISNAQYERLEELRDADLGETWQTIKTFQFDRFDRLEGVSAQLETESYDAAVRFAGTVLDEEVEVDHPSFLEDPAAFDHMMQYMDEESRVKMVWQALEHDPGEEMEALLDDAYRDEVETAMERELMQG